MSSVLINKKQGLFLLCVSFALLICYSLFYPDNFLTSGEEDLKRINTSEVETNDTVTKQKADIYHSHTSNDEEVVEQIIDTAHINPDTHSYYKKIEELEEKSIDIYDNIAENEFIFRFENEDLIRMNTNFLNSLEESKYLELINILSESISDDVNDLKYMYSNIIDNSLITQELNSFQFDRFACGEDVCALSVISYDISNEVDELTIYKTLKNYGFESKVVKSLRWKDEEKGTDRIGLVFTKGDKPAASFMSSIDR